jgi:hypothetical protein
VPFLLSKGIDWRQLKANSPGTWKLSVARERQQVYKEDLLEIFTVCLYSGSVEPGYLQTRLLLGHVFFGKGRYRQPPSQGKSESKFREHDCDGPRIETKEKLSTGDQMVALLWAMMKLEITFLFSSDGSTAAARLNNTETR